MSLRYSYQLYIIENSNQIHGSVIGISQERELATQEAGLLLWTERMGKPLFLEAKKRVDGGTIV